MKLSKEVEKKYELATNLKGGPAFNFGKFGVVDFSKLTLRKAESLVKQQFPHLREKKGSSEGNK